jgi:hypothetical protein
MKIANVEAFLISCPIPEKLALPFWGGVRTILKRDAMLVKISGDNGLTGYGPGPAFEGAAKYIATLIRQFLVGKIHWNGDHSDSREVRKQ